MPDVFDQILDAEQKPAAAQKDVFDVALDQMQSEEEQRLRSTLDAAGKANPDQAAEAQRLSGQTGMPADMVERNLDEVRRQARVQSMNLRDMMATSPVLSRQLTDLNFAKLAFDDHENLSGIEKGFRFLKNTGDALAAVVPRFAEQSYGLGQAVGDFLPSQLGGDAVANYFAGHRKHAKEVADYWMPNGDGVLERSWYSGMHSLGLNILNLPLAYGTGGMGRILTAMGAETGGQSYGQARDAGLNQYESLLFGSSQGVIEAGTEMIGMPALFGMLKPGQFATKAAEYMVKEQGGEQIATHLQDMNEWAMLHPEKSIGDYLSERPNAILETALSTAFAGGGQVAVMKGVEMVVNRGYKASAAEQRITALEQVQNLMAASKVLQRSPESMGSYVEQLAAETGAENVYLQSNVLSDPALAQELYQMSPAIAAQFKTAAAIGGEIRIPIAEYLTRIAPTHGTQLIDDIRIEGEQFTRREAVDFMQSQSEALQQEVERALGEQSGHAEFRASQEAVKQRILAELNNMNRFTEQKNELDATLIAARSAVRAAQLGMTPEQFFEKQLLRVQAEGMQGEQFDQAMMLEKATSAWQSSLKGVTKGKEYYVPVVHTPSILREFGYKARMFDLPSRVLEAINEKHPDIPEDVIQNLPKYIHAPRYVFKHKSGGLRMILNATTENGEPIAVGVEDGRIRTITPIHDENGVTGNDRVLEMVGNALTERGGKVYAENKEALEESRASLRILSGGSVLGSEGPQLPNPVSRHAATVFGMDSLVNKYGEGFYQNGIRLSRSSIGATHNGMNIRDLRALVSRIEKSYKNMPDVLVLESPEALDLADAEQKRLYDYIASNDAMNDVEGATHEGKIYLFASGLSDEFRAEFVIAQHEITHVGLRAVYGTEADAVLQTIWMNNQEVRDMAAEVKRARNITSNVEATEEVLADMPTSELVKLKGWRKLVQMVRNWFEKHGFTTAAKRLDVLLKAGMDERQQADLLVADVVSAAREWVKSGKSGQMGTIHDTRLSQSRRVHDDLTFDMFNANGQPTPEAVRQFISRQFEATDLAKHYASPDAQQDASNIKGQQNNIQDFGEKLGGARKDLAAAIKQKYSDDDLASLPLSKIWPADMAEKIEDKFVAAFAFAARHEIPSKPRKGYKLRAWVDKVKTLRELVGMMTDAATKERAEALLKSTRSLKGFNAKVALLQAIDREQWKRIGRTDEYPNAYTYDADGKQVPVPQVSVEIDGKRVRFEGAKSVADVIEQVNEKLGETAATKQIAFEVRGRGNTWSINKKGDPLYRRLKSFETSKEALNYVRAHNTELSDLWEAVKESDNVKESDLRSRENRDRSAEDWRKGMDVTAEQFSSEFGFRGIEFGNWVAQGKNTKERQGMLNAAYDALMDLASIINVPPKAMSLNGTLGLGFGSRGSGSASAHFEPEMLVINLTKTRGAGSLAHEWFHALDNYFQRERIANGDQSRRLEGGHSGDFITYAPENYYVHKRSGSRLPQRAFDRMIKGERDETYGSLYGDGKDPANWELKGGVRPEVSEAFADLVKALNESPMSKRASLIDAGKSGGYWSRIIERGARSFENYVIHKMMQSGYHNDYLANVTPADEFVRDKGRYPYLLEDEIAPVAAAFDNLFNTIKTRETDSGVQLYQGDEVNRGAFNPATNTISLLKNADLSTFLHEGAHYFFENDIALAGELVGKQQSGEALTEGEQQIVDDVSKLLAWNGIQGDIQDQLRQWGGMSFEERRAYHERVAESFESYLLEGKAPSIELQSAFQSFRAWLLNVYRSLKEFLNSHPEAGKLNDEVRQVFDRMLATTEQIKLAEQSRSLMPLFGTPEQAGMTVEEFARYQAMGTAATQAAIEELQTKGLRDMKWLQNARNRKLKALQREADDKRRQVRSTVRAEVMSQPVYRAWQLLTNKIGKSDKIDPMLPRKSDPNVLDETQDSLFVAIAKLGGIDKAQVIATWGTDAADKPSSHLFGKPVWRIENGLTIDGMAEALGQYGYLELDENGKPDVRELEEKWAAELSGDTQYSNAYQPDAFDQMRPGEQVPNLTAILSGRLDAHALREMSITDDQIKILQARGMVADDGLHPDLVADLPSIQIGSGDQMVHMLLEANEPKAEIERLTDERMLQMYGELASPEAIQKAADQAVHNDLRGKMLATEANILAKATGQRKILSDAARQFAADMIARLRVRDVKPAQYVNAEVRAAKAAEAATDMNVKAGEKRNQVIQHYAARAAYDALDEVEKGVRYLSKFGKDGTRKKISADYLDQIDAMLERFDLRKGQSLKEIDRRTTLAQWITAQEEAGAEPDIPDWLQLESNKTHYKNLTMEEFRGLVDAIKQIEHLGRFKERLINARDQRALNDIVEELTQQIEESSGGRIVDNEIRNELTSKAKALGKGFMAIHRKMANMIYEMDGFKYGPLWEHLIRTMNEAGDREASMRAEATIKLTELAKPILKGERMGGKGKFFPSLGRSLNRGERLAIALNWGNEGNRQRLMDGRNWSIYNLQPVLDSLTAEEWKFVQDVWDFFEGYRPEIGAKERRIYGKEPNWVEPTPFTIRTTDGQELNLRGGYYPIKYDVRQSGKAGEKAAQEEAATMMRAAHTAATTRRSFVKTRSAEIKGRPLLLSMDGIWQGANEVIHDLAFHEWLIDSSKLLKRLDPAIREHYGAEYMNEIKAAILDTARGEEGAKNTWERIVNHVRTGTTVAGLGWNLTTALLQPLGISNSIVRVGAGWMAKGMWQFYGNPVEMVAKAQQIQDKSEFMRNRARTMQREINEIQNQIMAAKSKAQQTLESSFFIMIQKLQAWVDYPTWLGEYEKAIAENHDEATAIAMADQAVIDSQGGGQTKDLARIQRGGPLQKLWTNFYSFFSVTLNLAVDKTKATDFKNPAQVAALAGDYVLLMVFPAIMGALMKSLLKGGDDDDDELAKQLIAEQISFLMGQFIGVRELTAAVQAATGVGIPGIGYSGPAGARLFSEMQRLGQQINQGEVDEAFLKAANNVAGILFHYPAGQVARTVQGAQALIDGETTNPLAPVVGPPRK